MFDKISAFYRYLFGDSLEIIRYRDDFIFGELTERAIESDEGVASAFVGLRFWPFKRIMIVTSDRVDPIAHLEDPNARILFMSLEKFFKNRTLIQENENFHDERIALHRMMDSTKCLKPAVEVFERLFRDWDDNKSINHQITAACIELAGSILLQMPLEPSEIDQLVDYVDRSEKVVFDIENIPQRELDEVFQGFKVLNDRLIEKYQPHIEKPDNYNYVQFLQSKDPQKEAKDLNPVLNLIALGNVAELLKGAVTLLAQKDNPYFERLKEEMHHAKGAPLESIQDFKKYPFLHRFYYESLRYFAVAGPVPRETSKRHEVENISIDNNTVIIVPLRAILRHPKHWERPDDFDPDRKEFDPENPHRYQLNKYPFIPFAEGRRVCPASFHFVELIFKTCLLELLQHDISLTSKGELTLETLSPLAKVARFQHAYYAHIAKHQKSEEEVLGSNDNKHVIRSYVR